MANILVYDDNQDILEMMQYVVSINGHVVETTFTLADFKQKIQTKTPNLILLDVMLSGYDGRNICSELRTMTQTKEIPIILMSASSKNLVLPEACGANDIIEKPFDINVLLDKINLHI